MDPTASPLSFLQWLSGFMTGHHHLGQVDTQIVRDTAAAALAVYQGTILPPEIPPTDGTAD